MTCEMPLVVHGKPCRLGVSICATLVRAQNHTKPTGIINELLKAYFAIIRVIEKCIWINDFYKYEIDSAIGIWNRWAYTGTKLIVPNPFRIAYLWKIGNQPAKIAILTFRSNTLWFDQKDFCFDQIWSNVGSKDFSKNAKMSTI